jgi:hypothetical protein
MFRALDEHIDLLNGNEPGLQDVPYQHQELATLSLLAGGIWRANKKNYVIQEFRMEKDSTRCRGDIWFSVAPLNATKYGPPIAICNDFSGVQKFGSGFSFPERELLLATEKIAGRRTRV